MLLDRLILNVNDVAESVRFHTQVLGMRDEGERPPFRQLRVSPDLVLLLGPRGTPGGEHLAFALSLAELEAAFRRVCEREIPFGDAYDAVGNEARVGAMEDGRAPRAP